MKKNIIISGGVVVAILLIVGGISAAKLGSSPTSASKDTASSDQQSNVTNFSIDTTKLATVLTGYTNKNISKADTAVSRANDPILASYVDKYSVAAQFSKSGATGGSYNSFVMAQYNLTSQGKSTKTPALSKLFTDSLVADIKKSFTPYGYTFLGSSEAKPQQISITNGKMINLICTNVSASATKTGTKFFLNYVTCTAKIGVKAVFMYASDYSSNVESVKGATVDALLRQASQNITITTR